MSDQPVAAVVSPAAVELLCPSCGASVSGDAAQDGECRECGESVFASPVTPDIQRAEYCIDEAIGMGCSVSVQARLEEAKHALAAPLPTAPEPTPDLKKLLDTSEVAYRHACAANDATFDERMAVYQAARAAIEARFAEVEGRVASLLYQRDDESEYNVALCDVVSAFATAGIAVGDEQSFESDKFIASIVDAVMVTITELRSTLSQVEGERDEAVNVANHHCHVIQELQARVEGLTAGRAAAIEERDSCWNFNCVTANALDVALAEKGIREHPDESSESPEGAPAAAGALRMTAPQGAPREAGRELDALIAEKVMGWGYQWGTRRGSRTRLWRVQDNRADLIMPLFSTDIADAWLVVGAMRAEGWRFELMASEANAESRTGFAFGEHCCRAVFSQHHLRFVHVVRTTEHSASGPTPMLAICLAALAAPHPTPEDPT